VAAVLRLAGQPQGRGQGRLFGDLRLLSRRLGGRAPPQLRHAGVGGTPVRSAVPER